VHFLRNALDYVPRKVDDDCLQELPWIYDRRELAEARRDVGQWLAKWQAKYPKLCDLVEENIEETLTYYRLPLAHHKHMKIDKHAGAAQPGAACSSASSPARVKSSSRASNPLMSTASDYPLAWSWCAPLPGSVISSITRIP
jgi:hypothetical protein